MRKVLLVCLSAGAGGAEHHVAMLADALGGSADVAVLTAEGGWLAEAVRGRIRTLTVPEPRGNLDAGVLLGVRRVVREESPDILHSHLGRSDWYCWLATAGTSRPALVSTEHGISVSRPELFTSRPAGVLHRLGHSLMHRRMRAKIAVSEYTAAALRERFGRGCPVRLVHPGVPLEVFAPAVTGRPQEPGVLRLLALSRLSYEKGVDILVEAVVSALDDGAAVRLTIAGDGPERERLEALASPAGDRVTFAGRSDDVVSLLASADVLVCPSRTENLPTAILEAVAAGVPVIASTVGGVPEVIADGGNGRLMPAEDAAALGRMLAELAGDPEQVSALSAGALLSSSEWNAGAMAVRTLEVYADALQG